MQHIYYYGGDIVEKKYTVYMHISPSNKRYIGITSQRPERRWQNGKHYNTQIYFYRAIQKYGWDNIQHVIIARGLTEDEAKWLEIEMIKALQTNTYGKGYNATEGGDGIKGIKHSDAWKQRQSERMKGSKHPMFGKNIPKKQGKR